MIKNSMPRLWGWSEANIALATYCGFSRRSSVLWGPAKAPFTDIFGFGFDINFPYNLVLTPNAAAGYYYDGQGLDLGSWWEFRTGAELDYRFADQRRLGVGFYHMSNAGHRQGKPRPGDGEPVLPCC